MLASLHQMAHSYMLYPMIMGIAWGISFNYVKDKVAKPDLKIFYLNFALIFVTSWLGAKILFLLTIPTKQSLYDRIDFWSGGGFVFYGGLLLAISVILLAGLINPQSKLHLSRYAKVYLKALVLGHAIGRIGCFVVGCCYGMYWLGFQLPVQLFESLGLIILFFNFPKNDDWMQNIVFYMTGYATLRFVLEFIRSDIERGEIFTIPSSQFISLCLLLMVGICKVRKLRF
jgi:phosphatidylglycerol:prolipoprotein diacylglycerol transferase